MYIFVLQYSGSQFPMEQGKQPPGASHQQNNGVITSTVLFALYASLHLSWFKVPQKFPAKMYLSAMPNTKCLLFPTSLFMLLCSTISRAFQLSLKGHMESATPAKNITSLAY